MQEDSRHDETAVIDRATYIFAALAATVCAVLVQIATEWNGLHRLTMLAGWSICALFWLLVAMKFRNGR